MFQIGEMVRKQVSSLTLRIEMFQIGEMVGKQVPSLTLRIKMFQIRQLVGIGVTSGFEVEIGVFEAGF